MTNADKIRSMSDKELYLFLSKWFVLPCQLCRWWSSKCGIYPKRHGCAYSDEYEAWETWIKQECKE